jgi:hypothetical protein
LVRGGQNGTGHATNLWSRSLLELDEIRPPSQSCCATDSGFCWVSRIDEGVKAAFNQGFHDGALAVISFKSGIVESFSLRAGAPLQRSNALKPSLQLTPVVRPPADSQ